MIESSLRKLEYNKILELLASMAGSNQGKEKALALTPSLKLNQIEYWQKETSEGKEILRLEPNIPLGGIRDIRNSMRKVDIGAILEPSDLLEIADTLTAGRRLKTFILESKGDYPILKELANRIGMFKEIEKKIKDSILPGGEISDNASPELYGIRRNIRQLQQRVKEKMESYLRVPNYQKMLQETIITIRGDRYVLPVKQEYRAQIHGIIHDQSASGATLYIEPIAIVEINNDVRRLQGEEKQEIIKILSVITNLISAYSYNISTTVETLGQLDFIFAKAKLSHKFDGVEPKVNDQGYLNIIKGRHPLIQGKVVPTDITLGKEFDSLIITGPNTGGKTVTLKTVGLFCMMAQSGLHLPAEPETETTIFEHVFVDIGDEQSIEQSLSTFSSHMLNIVDIINNVNHKSLVLFDELGAGTDPSEGAALAMAILDYLHGAGAKIIATTHYSELKTFAFNNPRIENASVEFDTESLRPTYKLLIGQPGRSNAFEIAQRLGLHEYIVKQGRSFLSKEEVQVSELIENLENTRREALKEKEIANKLKLEAEEFRNKYEKVHEETNLKKQQIIEKAHEDALAIVRQARREAEEAIEEMKRSMAKEAVEQKRQGVEEAKKKLKGLHGKLADKVEALKPDFAGQAPKNLRAGATVHIVNINQKGTVVKPPSDNGDVLVQVGIMKITVPLSQLRAIDENIETKVQKSGVGEIYSNKTKSIKTEIDLRGMTTDEAIIEVEKYLDDAYLAGLPIVHIIHGKGTGVLRKFIQQLVDRNKHVKSHRLGQYGEGGIGVTIVELKK